MAWSRRLGVLAPDKTCASCRFWSQWIGECGDCMAYAYARIDAMIATRDREAFARDWPQQPAIMTAGDEGCDHWEAKEHA